MRILIIGCGYVGKPLGALLAREGHAVFGLRRADGEDSELHALGIQPLRGDITNFSYLENLPGNFDAVINLVSSSKGGPDEYRQVYLEGTRNILRWLRDSPLRRYLYTSSTSVYAQADGSWVTEESPAEPESPTSQILIETERELLAARAERDFPSTVLRVSGIYGPGRGHLFQQFLRDEATLRDDGSAWINMIHVADLAAAIAHLISLPELPAAICNVTDSEPVTQLAFFTWLSQTLGRPLPPSAPADRARKRGLANKRVSNALLRSTNFQFTYPTFREGYTAEIQKLRLLPQTAPRSGSV
jgi:nucleoside-diphosphate-sugar epimerase